MYMNKELTARKQILAKFCYNWTKNKEITKVEGLLDLCCG